MAAVWHEPVRVVLGGVTHIIFDNIKAAEILLMGWPAKHGAHHRAAEQALLYSLRKPNDPDLAEQSRLAFAIAAREAGILEGGKTIQLVKYGYHLIDADGAETFTSNRPLADSLVSQGWRIGGYLALPISTTDAMVDAAERELAQLTSDSDKIELPKGGMRRVLSAALTQINGE